RGNTSLVAPLAWHPENRHAVIMVDLAGEMAPLLELDADALRERLYPPRAELGDQPAAPITLVPLQPCPGLAQAKTRRPQDA
ncbi:exodeoxyribonuclease I, partial [Klebsiella pneumoniae]|nr:exodeoxyribonuclease I [Klebsiella pneumoniae]